MKFEIKALLPYANVAKSWLTNLSVASFAVGLYEEHGAGIVCGTIFIVCALWVVYLEREVNR